MAWVQVGLTVLMSWGGSVLTAWLIARWALRGWLAQKVWERRAERLAEVERAAHECLLMHWTLAQAGPEGQEAALAEFYAHAIRLLCACRMAAGSAAGKVEETLRDITKQASDLVTLAGVERLHRSNSGENDWAGLHLAVFPSVEALGSSVAEFGEAVAAHIETRF